jgi:ElaB/YqjD/DUF883 family membrane-anchored ribosome-binding protein
MTMSTNSVTSITKSANKDARHAIDEATETADDLTHRMSAVAADAGAAVQDAARRVSAAAADIGQGAVDRGSRYSKEVMTQVKNQPLATMATVAVVGFVAGLLLARR